MTPEIANSSAAIKGHDMQFVETEKKTVLGLEWRRSKTLVPYPEAVGFMERRVSEIRNGNAAECIWLLEHPPLYTAGTSARLDDLLEPDRYPVFQSGRGGQYTYHGPGQRVVYVMLDLDRRGRDIRRFVHDLEEWLILTLDSFAIRGERRSDRVGIWVERESRGEDKIAALGLRVRRWVSFHGVAINVDPDLSGFFGIVPCGISDHGVTSLRDLGSAATMDDVDRALEATFRHVFGPPHPKSVF